MSKKIDYFYNEQGDYTLTLDNEPVGYVQTKENAEQIKMLCQEIKPKINEKRFLKAVKLAVAAYTPLNPETVFCYDLKKRNGELFMIIEVKVSEKTLKEKINGYQ